MGGDKVEKIKNYFSHDSNARNSDKLINVRMELGAEGYGVYFMILERLREEDEYKSRRDYKMIAFDLRVEVDVVKRIVEEFDLFELDNEYFYSLSFLKRMQVKDEKKKKRQSAGKAGANKRWDQESNESKNSNAIKNDSNAIAMPLKNDSNAIAKNSKEKKRKEKERKENNNINTASATANADNKSELCGRIWTAYPNKKGKIHAIKAIEKLLGKYTERQIIQAIVAYKADVESQRKSGFKTLAFKQGDTFFRTGIHDYLGADDTGNAVGGGIEYASSGLGGKDKAPSENKAKGKYDDLYDA